MCVGNDFGDHDIWFLWKNKISFATSTKNDQVYINLSKCNMIVHEYINNIYKLIKSSCTHLNIYMGYEVQSQHLVYKINNIVNEYKYLVCDKWSLFLVRWNP